MMPNNRWSRFSLRLPTVSILGRNAFWNVVAGLSGAIVNVALPPFLSRVLDRQTFGVWLLALQVAGYVNLLSFGFQVVVGRLVAQANATGDTRERDKVVATSFFVLVIAGGAGVLGMLGLSTQVGIIAPHTPLILRPQLAAAIVLLAASFALQLPASTFGAVFVGLQRNAFYSLSFLATRVATIIGVLVVGYLTLHIVPMAVAWFAASAAGVAFSASLWWRYIPAPRLRLRDFSGRVLREMVHAGAAFTLWNLAMLFVSGFQLLIVARVDYNEIGAFGVAASISLFGSGIMQAICSTIVPNVSHSMALEQNDKVNDALTNMTMLSTLLSAAMTGTLIAGSGLIMHIFLGRNFTPAAPALLAFLALAQFIRNGMLAYVMVAIAAGVQSRMLVTPLIEGAISFGGALMLGSRFGAIGIAYGMCLGACTGLLIVACQNVLRVKIPDFHVMPYLYRNVILPAGGLALVVPTFVLTSLTWRGPSFYPLGALLLSMVGTFFLCRRNIKGLYLFLVTHEPLGTLPDDGLLPAPDASVAPAGGGLDAVCADIIRLEHDGDEHPCAHDADSYSQRNQEIPDKSFPIRTKPVA
jgi:O-antigen/teichoic acid export membrane protein